MPVPAVALLPWLPLPRGHLTTRRVLDVGQQETWANRCIHMCVHTHTHSLHILHSQEMAGNMEKRKRGSRRSRKGPSFVAGSFRRATESSCSLRSETRWNLSSPDSPFSTRQTTSGKDWYRAFKVLSGISATCKQDAANENKGLSWSLPNQAYWRLLDAGKGSAPPKPLGHFCL